MNAHVNGEGSSRVVFTHTGFSKLMGPIFEQWSKPWFKPPLNHAETWSV